MTGMTKAEPDGLVDAPMPSTLKVWTGVSGIICSAHEGPTGKLHGHTWEVKAWWLDGRDADEARSTLASYLSRFDHDYLPNWLSRGELIAKAVLKDLDCDAVDVSRPLEGIFARAEITSRTPNPKGAGRG